MANIQTRTPDASHLLLWGTPFEQDWNKYDYSVLADYKKYEADLIILRIGENVDDSKVESGKLRESYLRLIDGIAAPNSKIILTNSFWKNRDRFNAVIRSIAVERNLPLVNLTDLSDDPSNMAYGLFDNPGVAAHPGDKGMAAIADRILSTSYGTSSLSPRPSSRYLSLSIMNVEDGDYYLPIMERAAAAGVNSFILNVNWDHIYRQRGSSADWSQVDKEAELAQRLGCKIMLRVWVARHGDGNDGWWPENMRPISGDGVRHTHLNGFSLSAEEAVEEANSFVRETMEHFRPRQQAGQVALVGVVFNNASEVGYSVDAFNPTKQKNELQLFDYSYYSKKAFQQWLETRYKTLANLNEAWSADYSRFQDVNPPYIKGDVWSGNYGKAGQDWYLFRHFALKKVIDKFRSTVNQADPGYKYYLDMGSVYDGLSGLRATLGFKNLAENTNALKINDAPSYPHRFAMDLVRSNLPGKIIGNEFEYTSAETAPQWRDQINESFEHGADWINIFGFDLSDRFALVKPLIKETAAKWLDKPVPAIQTTQTVTYTLSEAIRQGTNAVQGRWRTEYNKSKKPIEVLLTEDLLGDKPGENQPPKVGQPIADQQGKVGQTFGYEIPANTFTDADGSIVGLTAAGLPAGIVLTGWKLAGTPTTIGSYTVTVKARDDRGAEVSTQFKFTVAPKEGGANQPPVVSQPIPDQLGKVGQTYDYEISLKTFTDPDGTIASVTFKGLPDGIVTDNRALSGNPTTNGTFNVTVTARDDKGAEVSTQFKFTVAPKEGSANQPPVVSQTIPDQRGVVGQAFDYEIPKATFTDTDGTIADISAQGLPAGIMLVGWKLTGSPSASGTFTVALRAQDNQGAGVTTQFKIMVAPAPTSNVFSLFQAGNFLTRRFLHYITDGDTLRGDDAKTIVNILVSPKTGAVGSYRFKMEGPYSVGSTDNKAPYGVFGDNGGVIFAAGRYTLNVKSYESADLEGTQLSDETIHFVVVDDEENRNLSPVLVKPPVELFAKVGTSFARRLPDSTFVDPDGVITSFVITDLPDGLKGDGTLITGTPTKKGVFNPIVRVTDNGGGAAETTFKFTISADNLPPIVSGKIADQTIPINQPFSYTIPEDVFTDPDGTIASVTILGLPEGMKASGRTLSGTPTKAGKYQLVATARDNADATAQLTFSLTVVSENLPPQVVKAIPDQVADSNAVYSYVIPAGTFTDLDGKIARLEISNLPPQLVAKGDTISGRLTQPGEFGITVRAFDDREASVQLTFRLTVRGNLPPQVTKAIPDQVADSNAVYNYVIPAGTFVDPDGKIVRFEFLGLPGGLNYRNDTIRDRPFQVGVFDVQVRAFDDRGASVKTNFTFTVRGVNAPPVAQPIPDVVAIMGQIFRFDVKQYFKDTDGTIASISYASALPPGVTANGSLLAGNPTAVGEYPMKVEAKDNKGASIIVEFMIRVERAELRVVMYQPGLEPKKVREIANADIIPLGALPADVDLYVESNADLSSMTFELTGPTSRKYTDEAAPFGLYDDAVGFKPKVGTYKLKVTAYRNNTLVTSRSIQFDIIKANNAPVRLGVEEEAIFPTTELWKAYPNPFVDVVKVQMDERAAAPKAVEILTVEGRSTRLNRSKWRVESSVLKVDLSEHTGRRGIYLLRITGQDGQSHTMRIMKSSEK